MDLSTC